MFLPDLEILCWQLGELCKMFLHSVILDCFWMTLLLWKRESSLFYESKGWEVRVCFTVETYSMWVSQDIVQTSSSNCGQNNVNSTYYLLYQHNAAFKSPVITISGFCSFSVLHLHFILAGSNLSCAITISTLHFNRYWLHDYASIWRWERLPVEKDLRITCSLEFMLYRV